jgi:two-component system, LuxR family, sensor kinase FixL
VAEHISQEHIAYLSRSALAFVDVHSSDDLYQKISELLREFLGDAIVIVSSYDSENSVLEQRALRGLPVPVSRIASVLGMATSPMKLAANPESQAQIESGRLTKIEEGLYEPFLRTVPRAVTRAAERLMNITSCYGMGCVADGRCFGGIVVCLRGDTTLPPVEVLEAFVYQAAVALKRYEAEDALRRSEARYRMLMEFASDPYIVTNGDGCIIEVNQTTLDTLGYTREAIVGTQITSILDPEETAADPIPWNSVGTQSRSVRVRRMRQANGQYMTFELGVAGLPDGDVFLSARDVTQRRQLERVVIETEDRERRAVGRDLHDSLGQELAALSYRAGALGRRLTAEGHAEDAEAKKIAALLSDAVAQTRRMAHGLCPVDMSEEGIVVALEQLAATIGATGSVSCNLKVDGPISGIPPGGAIHLYQIAQEAANNALRHGRAKVVTFLIRTTASRGELTICDDGCGFLAGDEKAQGGFGLRTMRYRAEMIEGSLRIDTGTDGTTVTCLFPCVAESPRRRSG